MLKVQTSKLYEIIRALKALFEKKKPVEQLLTYRVTHYFEVFLNYRILYIYFHTVA